MEEKRSSNFAKSSMLKSVLHIFVFSFFVVLTAVGCDNGIERTVAREKARKELIAIGAELLDTFESSKDEASILKVCKQLGKFTHLNFVSSSESTGATNELAVLFDTVNFNDGVTRKPIVVRVMEKGEAGDWDVLILDSSTEVEFAILNKNQFEKLLSFKNASDAAAWIADLK